MTIEWFNPSALLALPAAIGPIVVHLLRRNRATHLAFPTVRFLTPSRSSAVRVNMPADPWLLVLRVAIIAGAAIAWAQPFVITEGRRLALERSLARAIVVDTSRSMDPVAARAREAASAERQGVAFASEIASDDVSRGLRAAVERLKQAPPVRREVVLISDFQVGAISAMDLAALPDDVGIRFVPIDPAGLPDASPPVLELQTAIGSSRTPALSQTVTLQGDGTAVVFRPSAANVGGLRVLVADAERDSADRLLEAVVRAGAPALHSDRALTVAFPGAGLASRVSLPRQDWMIRAIVNLRLDRELREAAAKAEAMSPFDGDAWVTVATDSKNRPLILAAGAGHELIMRIAARPTDFIAAAALRAALFGAADRAEWREHEAQRISPETLESWSRAAVSLPRPAVVGTAPGDAAWCWAGVLVLLLVETIVRRHRSSTASQEIAASAA